MTHYKQFVITTVILLISLQNSLYGQETNGQKRLSAVLVQLKAERNRTNALIKAQRYADLEIFRKDVFYTRQAMINDFRDHFNYCPVYYYFDTNYEAISQGKFEGVLLDDHLAPAQNIVINGTNTDYLIVYFGHAAWQTNKKNFWDTTRSALQGGAPTGYALVINDYKLRQINYVYRLDDDFFNFRRGSKKNRYRYVSKKFDIYYYPAAAEFNRRLIASHKKK